MRLLSETRCVVGVAIVVFLLGSSERSARAQQLDPLAAEALFQEARAAAKKGDYATACPKFQESYRLDPTPGTLLNIADCEENTGKIATAWLHYKHAHDLFGANDPRSAYAHQRVQILEPHLPRLTISLSPSSPADTTVTRDGVYLGPASLGVPLPVDPGAHVVLTKHPSYGEKKTVVEVGADQKVVIEVSPPEQPIEQPVKRTVSWWTPTRILGGSLAALGSLSLIASAGTGALVLDRKQTVDQHCDEQLRCDPQGVNAAKQGRQFSTVSTITFAAGATALTAGVTLILVGGPSQTSLAATTSPSHVGLSLHQAF